MKYIPVPLIRSLCFLIFNIAASSVATAQSSTTVSASSDKGNSNLDITAFGFLRSWNNAPDALGLDIGYSDFNKASAKDSSDIGVFWWEPRDIEKIQLTYQKKLAANAEMPVVQYWQHNWPEPPPHMPSTEDVEDDPWQGQWLTAATDVTANGKTVVYTFKPLTDQENAHAHFLPGSITYRRALKVRLLYPAGHQSLGKIRVFSVASQAIRSIRIQTGMAQEKASAVSSSIDIFNGRLKNISKWNWDAADKKTGKGSWLINLNGKPKGVVAAIYGSGVTLPGSNDETIVTLRSSNGTFSFLLSDVEKGPVYVPAFDTYITRADDPVTFSKANIVSGKTIRERIPREPEQSYDRARKEIPPLDPTSRDGGGYIDLPLASDASWQKFAVQWGGNIIIDKQKTKAKGKELARCNWTGNGLLWGLGTGEEPVYKRTLDNCRMSILNDYLPVVRSAWNHEGLHYSEEAFTTLVHGPLSASDPDRDEQTPAILLVKLVVSNPSLHADTSHIWLTGNDALNGLSKDGAFLMDKVEGKEYIRCYIKSLQDQGYNAQLVPDSTGKIRSLHQTIMLGPNSSQTVFFYFPFVGDLTAGDQQEIASLDYEASKERVVSFWRDLVAQHAIFNVPERKFNEMSKAIIPHIRMSVTKDPRSNLYMVPAAAFNYYVYPNEAIFQTLLLDRLGDFKTVSDYLHTFLALQGSSKLPGTFTGDQKDVFFGTRVDSVYDYTEGNGYNMHHGIVLWGLASHYLYSGDREWLLKAAPNMIRAANWIVGQRKHTMKIDKSGNRVTHYGLLPAGVLEDVHDWRYWYATNAYSCLGMEAMVSAFEKAGLPEAKTFKAEAAAYHSDIRRSIEKAMELCPVIRLRNNTYVPYVPCRPHQRFRYFGSKKAEYYDRYQKKIYPTLRLSAIREALYGPVVLLKTGLVDPNEPMAGWILDDWEDNLTLSSSLNLTVHGRVDDEYWFSQGGMVFQANLQNPVGVYLMRHEIPAAIRGLYDNFVSCLYPDINAQTEEYHQWTHGSGPFYKCPDEARVISQVYDLLLMEENGEIWLANGVPQRWLEAGQRVELFEGHTACGEISYELRPGKSPQTIEADIKLPEGTCSKIILFVRAPFQKQIRSVTVNGKDWKEFNAEKESVVIPQTAKNVHILISY